MVYSFNANQRYLITKGLAYWIGTEIELWDGFSSKWRYFKKLNSVVSVYLYVIVDSVKTGLAGVQRVDCTFWWFVPVT